jgi:hypothetical protein
MGIFNRTVNKAAISPPPAKAAAAGAANYTSRNNGGANMIGQYYSYVEGDARNRAMSVPTISSTRPYGIGRRLHELKNVYRNVER